MRSCISYNWNKTTKTKTKKSKQDTYPQEKRLFGYHSGNQLWHKSFLSLRWNDIMKTASQSFSSKKKPWERTSLKISTTNSNSKSRSALGGRGEGSERRSFCLFLSNSKTIPNYRSDIILLTWYQVKQQWSQNYDKYRETLRQRYEDIQRNTKVP